MQEMLNGLMYKVSNTLRSTAARFGAVVFALQMMLLSAVNAVAQDNGGGGKGLNVDVDVNKGGGSAWYSQWWVWVIIILVFIVVIVAITNRGKKD